MTLRRRTALAALASSALAATTPRAFAQTWPERPLKIIAPFGPGSPTDLLARAVAEGMSADLGQPVVIENRPGAGGTIGAALAAKAAPDGYTLYLGTSSHAIAASLYRKLSYDSVADFAGVGEVAVFRLTLLAHPRPETRDLRSFIEAMRAAPGKYTFGSSGNGSTVHLAAELFNQQAGVKGVHVPFKGGNEVLAALLSGTVDYGFFSLDAALPHVRSGALNALATAAPARNPRAPQVPTFAEAGMPEFDAGVWDAMFVPHGTPRPVIERLHRALEAALHAPAIQPRVAALSAELVLDSTPESTDALLRREVARWAPLVRASGAQVN